MFENLANAREMEREREHRIAQLEAQANLLDVKEKTDTLGLDAEVCAPLAKRMRGARTKELKRTKTVKKSLPLYAQVCLKRPSGASWVPNILLNAKREAVALEATLENFEILVELVTAQQMLGTCTSKATFRQAKNGVWQRVRKSGARVAVEALYLSRAPKTKRPFARAMTVRRIKEELGNAANLPGLPNIADVSDAAGDPSL